MTQIRDIPAAVKFEVGKTYCDRSACNYKVIDRTAKQLTIREHHEIFRRRIYIYDGVEHCKPDGTYSMCRVIRADRESP